MNPALDRYINASLAKHFAAVCSGTIEFLSEREIRDTNDDEEWVVLRVIGPNYELLQDNEYIISLEIDLLVSVIPDKTNIFRLDDITGILASNCNNIPISSADDSGHLFCLTLDRDIPKPIRIVPYGQEHGIKYRRASVMAIYETETTIS